MMEQKQKKVNKNFVLRVDGGPVTRSKTNSSWADVSKLNCDPKQNLIKKQFEDATLKTNFEAGLDALKT